MTQTNNAACHPQTLPLKNYMQLTFTLELGNQVGLRLLPGAFKKTLPKQVAVLIYHKQLVCFADVFIEENEIKASADIPAELLILAPVPVFEVEDETMMDDGSTTLVTEANLLSIGLMPHKPGDVICSLAQQIR